MGTLTQPQPGSAVPAARLLSAPLAATFLAEFSSLTSFFLLLSVMPMLAAAAGASSSGAGLITGSLLLGTVAAEAAAAAAIRRFGYRTVLAAGAVLLGGGPGPARARTPGRHGERQLCARPRVRVVRRDHRCAHRQAAASRTARRRARPARRRRGCPRRGRAAGRGLAGRTPSGRRGGGHRRRRGPAAAGSHPLAAGWARGTAGHSRAADAGHPQRADGGHPPRADGQHSAAAADLRRRDHRGRCARLVPAARERDPQQPLLGRPARPGGRGHVQPLAGWPARRPARSRPPAHPGARCGGARHGHDAAAGLGRGAVRRHGAVRRRVRGDRERDVRAADRATARGQGQCAVELRLRRRVRRRPGRLRPVLHAHRLPGGVRSLRRADPRRGPGRVARAEGRGRPSRSPAGRRASRASGPR